MTKPPLDNTLDHLRALLAEADDEEVLELEDFLEGTRGHNPLVYELIRPTYLERLRLAKSRN